MKMTFISSCKAKSNVHCIPKFDTNKVYFTQLSNQTIGCPLFSYTLHLNYLVSEFPFFKFKYYFVFSCNSTSVSTFPKCLRNGTDHVTSQDVLHNAGIDLPIYCYISTLFILFIASRVAAYLALRFRQLVPR